ncbi:MAG: glycosyltransferase [Deltaproteobacteria bacterium]|nr:glycosyltransferase [Deltaproteobacteria bacterium]
MIQSAKPFVRASVIINNYNYGRFLRRSIDSVLNQTNTSFELIVVDDGSLDNSREIISSYGNSIIPVLKKNGGHASAFNAGFQHATGDIIFFLDSDDAMVPQTIERVLDKWKPGVVMVHYFMQVVDGQGNKLGVFPAKHPGLASGDVVEDLLKTGSFPTTLTSGLAFSRTALKKVMPIDEATFRQAADGYLVRAVAMQGPVQAIDECLACWTRHGSNDSRITADYEGLLKGIRRQMRYMANELGAVPQLARQFGFDPEECVENQAAEYLLYRLFSLSLDPAGHPLTEDTVSALWKLFCIASLKKTGSLSSKLQKIALASLVRVSPSPVSEPLIRFHLVAESRPVYLRKLNQLKKYIQKRLRGAP